MKNLPCKTVRAAFSAYLDGAVSGRQMQQIARHIEGFESETDGERVVGCSDCASELASGAIIIVEDQGYRVRRLPIRR